MRRNNPLILILLLGLFLVSCSKTYTTLSENLPDGLETEPCTLHEDDVFWSHVFVSDDGKALLLNKHDDSIRYYAENMTADQNAKAWYESFFDKMAEEAVNTGISGIQFYVPKGLPVHLKEEGATYYVESKDAQDFEKVTLLCAVSKDRKYVVFSAANIVMSKSKLIKNRTIYKRVLGGQEKDDLEASILKRYQQLLNKKQKGSKLIREPASISIEEEKPEVPKPFRPIH